MFFNSLTFIFGFLPIVLFLFYSLKKYNLLYLVKYLLIISSLIFYGWQTKWFVIVLLSSTIITYYSVFFINLFKQNFFLKNFFLWVGIIGSLGNLIIWKYSSDFFILIDSTFRIYNFAGFANLVIPLGISFYTFQQLTYVFDAKTKNIKNISFIDYCLYITFFPQLIIGPIVLHNEFIPQIKSKAFGIFRFQNIIIGFFIFIIGLAKKVLIADNLAIYVDSIFYAANNNLLITSIDAWAGAFGYTFQLYFDFSGYSDMALGIARMFGLKLPENFYSPLKAISVMDFWRRWHITLTRLTTKFIFNPIALYFTRYCLDKNLSKFLVTFITIAPASLLTFVIIGFWHGASLNFILFGFFHSILAILEYLFFPKIITINTEKITNKLKFIVSRIYTLFSIVLSLVIFRSNNLQTLGNMYQSLFSFNFDLFASEVIKSYFICSIFLMAFFISQFSLNISEIFKQYKPVIKTYTSRKIIQNKKISSFMLLFLGFIFTLSILFITTNTSQFLYADF